MYDEADNRPSPIKLLLLLAAAVVVGLFVFSLKPASGEFEDGSFDADRTAGDSSLRPTEFVRTTAPGSGKAGTSAQMGVDAGGAGGSHGGTIARLSVPAGFSRVASAGEMTDYCRRLPLRPEGTPVRLFDGTLKEQQDYHVAVLDIDVGKRDLQQCADALMRIRGEYLFEAGRFDDITFNFTSGDACAWNKWKEGWRPVIAGNEVSWEQKRPADNGYQNFRNYMNIVFAYAGSASLAQEMTAVPMAEMQIGDVLIKGGYPGHAVMVLDMAKNARGKTLYLLAQSYTPAQDIHVLKNLESRLSPWYELDPGSEIATPEWTFQPSELKRFR